MLQRRKRYKNRTILGYKTLAAGSIDMAEVPPGRADLATRALPPLFLPFSAYFKFYSPQFYKNIPFALMLLR